MTLEDLDLERLKASLRRRRETARTDVAGLRDQMSALSTAAILPTIDVAGRHAIHLPAVRADRPALFYVHGGGFVAGSPSTHYSLVGAVAKAIGGGAWIVDYPLAPEHPYPAALDYLVEAFKVVCRDVEPSRIVLAGDSAGAGLVVAVLQQLTAERTPLPGCAVLMSPWLDLQLLGKQRAALETVDPTLSLEALRLCATLFDPEGRFAPLAGKLDGLPPILVQCGSDELLADDALHLAALCGSARIEVEPEGFHVFQSFAPRLPMAREAIARIASFVDQVLP